MNGVPYASKSMNANTLQTAELTIMKKQLIRYITKLQSVQGWSVVKQLTLPHVGCSSLCHLTPASLQERLGYQQD